MITRQEIRVGNCIEQGIVDCIHPDTIEVLNGNARRFITLFEANAIPITIELLKSSAFTPHGNAIFSKPFDEANLKRLVIFKVDHRSPQWGIGFADYYSGKEKSETLPLEIMYWHQLQNLWFCLIGEELE